MLFQLIPVTWAQVSSWLRFSAGADKVDNRIWQSDYGRIWQNNDYGRIWQGRKLAGRGTAICTM
jgi:hypothetical protein